MPRVTAYPTIEWLQSHTSDRPALPSSLSRRQAGNRAGSTRKSATRPVDSLAGRIERLAGPGVRVATDGWVTTPDGDLDVDLMITKGERRLAVMFTGDYEHRTAEADSLRLVYGRFDGLLRLRGASDHGALMDVLYAIVLEKQGWFTEVGRVRAGRWASPEGLLALSAIPTQRTPSGLPVWRLGTHSISRMRMCRATDWVRPFEQALAGRIVAYSSSTTK